MKPMLAMAREAEAGGLLAASVFGGFPLADIQNAGLSVVTVADGNRAQAEEQAERMLVEAWKEKEEWIFHSDPLDQTIARAKEMTDGPIILLDHYDNAASGGTMDTMTVLGAIIDSGLEGVATEGIAAGKTRFSSREERLMATRPS